MTDFDSLIKRATQIAKEEGLLRSDRVKIARALPDPRDAKVDLASVKKVMQRLEEEEGLPNLKFGSNQSTADQLQSSSERERIPAEPKPSQANSQDVRVSAAKAEVIIAEQLNFLSKWHDINATFAKNDQYRYWALKIPALISSVSVSAFEAFGYGQAVILLGVVTAFCVGIDAVFPGGQLHNIHKRAANEIRRLQHDVLTKWRQVQLGPDSEIVNGAQEVLRLVQENRERIDTYVTEAEASLGKADSANSN
jgi:hypothetical protein